MQAGSSRGGGANRIIVFIAGGMTYAEMRTVYEYENRAVFIGTRAARRRRTRPRRTWLARTPLTGLCGRTWDDGTAAGSTNVWRPDDFVRELRNLKKPFSADQ